MYLMDYKVFNEQYLAFHFQLYLQKTYSFLPMFIEY